jgi:hypothetical protein
MSPSPTSLLYIVMICFLAFVLFHGFDHLVLYLCISIIDTMFVTYPSIPHNYPIHCNALRSLNVVKSSYFFLAKKLPIPCCAPFEAPDAAAFFWAGLRIGASEDDIFFTGGGTGAEAFLVFAADFLGCDSASGSSSSTDSYSE